MICRCPREPRLNYARLSTKRSGVVTQGQTNIDLSSARPSMGPLDPQSWRGHIGCEPRKYDQKGGRRCDTKSMIICFFIFVFYQSGSKEIDNGHVIAKPPVEFRRRSMQFFFQVLENWIFSCVNPKNFVSWSRHRSQWPGWTAKCPLALPGSVRGHVRITQVGNSFRGSQNPHTKLISERNLTQTYKTFQRLYLRYLP